jgi:molybdopterin-binding protein
MELGRFHGRPFIPPIAQSFVWYNSARPKSYLTTSRRGLNMEISARNMLKGKVKSIQPGAVNSEITIELAGGQQIVSVITKASADRLQLKPKKQVYAVIKSSDVMIAVD